MTKWQEAFVFAVIAKATIAAIAARGLPPEIARGIARSDSVAQFSDDSKGGYQMETGTDRALAVHLLKI